MHDTIMGACCVTDKEEVAWGRHEAVGCLEEKRKEKEKMGHCIGLWFGLLPWALVWAITLGLGLG